MQTLETPPLSAESIPRVWSTALATFQMNAVSLRVFTCEKYLHSPLQDLGETRV